MILRIIITSFLMLFMAFSLSSQSKLQELASDIAFYSDIVANASLPKTKARANQDLVEKLETFLDIPGSYEFEFPGAIWMSIKSPSDNIFKIYTWELQEEDGRAAYFGYLQMADGKVIRLKDVSDDVDDLTYMEMDKDFWYGSLYYNLLEKSDDQNNPYYLLFGFNQQDRYTRHKVVDVLSIENGEVKFGKEVFQRSDPQGAMDKMHRIHITYSADANVSLNYNPGMDMIIYDHLIPRMGNLEGQGPTMLPDGSYCAFQPLEDGSWKFVDKLFHEVSETAPRPKPVLGKEGKDLFGNIKKN